MILRVLAILLALVLTTVAIAVGGVLVYYDVREVRPRLPEIRNAAVSYGALTPEAAAVVVKVEPHWEGTLVRQLRHDLGVRHRGMGEYHLQGLAWIWLLRAHMNRSERLALFARYLPFDGGMGMAEGGRKYFGKELRDLTSDEVIGLLAVARSPRRNDPLTHPDNYQRTKKLLQEKYATQ